MSFLFDVLMCALTYFPVIIAGYLLFTLMRFPDISFEVTWALGGIVTLHLVAEKHLLPLQALPFAPLVGAACGAFTYVLFRLISRQKLLAGLISYFLLLVVGSRVLDGRAVVRIENARFGLDDVGSAIVLWSILCCVLLASVYAWEKSRHGVRARMIGETNDEVSVIFGLRSDRYYLIVLALAGLAAAISGATFSLYNGSATNAFGVGVVIKAIFGALAGDRICRLVHLARRSTVLSVPLGALALGLVLVSAEELALILQKAGVGFDMRDTDKHALVGVFLLLLLVWRNRIDPLSRRVSDL